MKRIKLFIKTVIVIYLMAYILIFKFGMEKKMNIEQKSHIDHNPVKDAAINEINKREILENQQQNKVETKLLEKRVDYKPNDTNWETLEPLMYFKRSIGYYFIDQQFGRLVFVTHMYQNNFSFLIEMNIYKNDILIAKHQIEEIRIEIESVKRDHIRMYSPHFDFKLDSLEEERDNFINNLNDYKMEVFIKNYRNNHQTQSPIELKIKNLRKVKNDPKVEYAMVCGKCIQFSNDLWASVLRWWFELHLQIGYSKIRFCNNSIPNTPAYNDLFYE
jgi:hypothetical protein